EFDQLHVIPCGCIVQGGVVVHSTLLDIRAARQKQFDELALVRTVGGYGRDKRGKAGVILIIRIGSEFEQRADERERTVINRVLQLEFIAAQQGLQSR